MLYVNERGKRRKGERERKEGRREGREGGKYGVFGNTGKFHVQRLYCRYYDGRIDLHVREAPGKVALWFGLRKNETN